MQNSLCIGILVSILDRYIQEYAYITSDSKILAHNCIVEITDLRQQMRFRGLTEVLKWHLSPSRCLGYSGTFKRCLISQESQQQNCYINCSNQANENWKLTLQNKFQVFAFQCFFRVFFANISHGFHTFLINEKVIHPKPLCNMLLLLPAHIYHFCIFKNWEQEENLGK